MFHLKGGMVNFSTVISVIIFAVLWKESTGTNVTCDCTNAETRVVCGSNGLSYENKCRLNCARSMYPDLIKIGNGYCGMGDLESICNCPRAFTLICGANGRNYLSECHLECDKRRFPALKKLKDGVCSIKEFFSPGPAISGCNCPKVNKPVCATDGVTYSNMCHFECGQKINPDIIVLAETSCWFVDKLKITGNFGTNGTNSSLGTPLEQGLAAMGLPPVTEERGNEIKNNITEFFKPLTEVTLPPVLKNLGKRNGTDNKTLSHSEEMVETAKKEKAGKTESRQGLTDVHITSDSTGIEATAVKKQSHTTKAPTTKGPTTRSPLVRLTTEMRYTEDGYDGSP